MSSAEDPNSKNASKVREAGQSRSALWFVILILAGLTYRVGAEEEEGRFKFECPGYEDTPMIPGTSFKVHQKDRPQPPRVIPPPPVSQETGTKAPSDATVLFDGTNLDRFRENKWAVREGLLIAGRGKLVTKEAYGDVQIHVEWRTPEPKGPVSSMGNSGLFLMGLYELQIYDSFSSKIYADGSAGAVYGQTPPLVNVCRRPGEWQTFDVIFKAPIFAGGELTHPARITVLHNGVVIQNNTTITGPVAHRNVRNYKPHAAKLPLMLQGHGSPVAFRNIWIREMSPAVPVRLVLYHVPSFAVSTPEELLRSRCVGELQIGSVPGQ
jgi:hypothetical protein